ncbi:MAG: hypothetical protein ABI598_01130 [Chloroflexota bacterium]
MTARTVPRRRLGLLALAGAALLAGLTGALVLLGLTMPIDTIRLGASHGPLMTLGFLGTLIALERAAALDRPWGYLAPLASGLGAAAFILGLPAPVGAFLLATGGALFVAMYVAFDRIERSMHTTVQGFGGLAWLVAAMLLVGGRPMGIVTPWLAAFLVLTIVGERLELSRLGRPSEAARRAFIGVVGVFALGVTTTLVAPEAGIRVGGVGLVLLALWLARYDIARRTVHRHGVTRFVALSLLAGYAWLAVAGAGWLAFGSTIDGSQYDLTLHALFLGFVISMVFGHAPIILPAVLRTPLPYQPRFYAHLVLLHAGLLLRIVGGDLLGSETAWQTGGVLNVTALLLFVVSSAVALVGASAPMLSKASIPPRHPNGD